MASAIQSYRLDVVSWSAIGREFTIATNQVDFAVPARFGLTNRDRDNSNKTPLCIHRAPLGTHEQFIGFLIEHYAGNFPLWLAPDQVPVITIGDDEPLLNYAKGIVNELRTNMVRVEGDFIVVLKSHFRKGGRCPAGHRGKPAGLPHLFGNDF